jgi:thioesterase domain-containing protein
VTMSTSTAEFLATLREREIRVWADNGQLRCEAPPGALDEDLRAQLVARKQELLDVIGAAEATLSAPRSIVPLKASGQYPPLFARPGHNGDVFCYRALAEHLDDRRPLYGIEPKGLDGSPPAETVEEMARYEVEQIRASQREGPYFIAGYCAGGSVAYESARQLQLEGAEVARLVMFASPFPAAYRASGSRDRLRSLGHRARLHASQVAAGSLSDGLGYLREHGRDRAARTFRPNDPAVANRRRVEEATIAAVERYEPAPYAGRVDIFLPNEAWRHSGDLTDEWKKVAGHVVEHIGPDNCNGDTMLLEPHVRALAGLLNPSLGDERGRDGSS